VAIYHCSIKIVSRGKGKSAVAAATYRAGERILNEYDGITHEYTKKGGVVYTEILLPEHAPPEYKDRAVLWNAIEKIEKAKNSQLAREIELALPVELTREQNTSLVREYAKQNFVEKGDRDYQPRGATKIVIHIHMAGNPSLSLHVVARLHISITTAWQHGYEHIRRYYVGGDGIVYIKRAAGPIDHNGVAGFMLDAHGRLCCPCPFAVFVTKLGGHIWDSTLGVA